AIAVRIIKLAKTAVRTVTERVGPVSQTDRVSQAAEEIDVLLRDEGRDAVDWVLRRGCRIVIDDRDRGRIRCRKSRTRGCVQIYCQRLIAFDKCIINDRNEDRLACLTDSELQQADSG